MIKKTLCTVLTLITLSTIATIGHAETCYNVEGDVNTINVSETAQLGTIHLILTDESGNEAFNDSGDLVGLITGATNDGATVLSHIATFSKKKNLFITSGDKATIADPVIRLADASGVCSYWISERISTIAFGSGFFKNVTSVDINASGYISTCISENENYFELSGVMCMK